MSIGKRRRRAKICAGFQGGQLRETQPQDAQPHLTCGVRVSESGFVSSLPKQRRGGERVELRYVQAWLDAHPEVSSTAEELQKRIGAVGQAKACAEALKDTRRSR